MAKIIATSWCIAAVIWGLAASVVVVRDWPSQERRIDDNRQSGRADCERRYAAADARQRCADLFDLIHAQETAIALFNRVAALIAPLLIGIGLQFYVRRRR